MSQTKKDIGPGTVKKKVKRQASLGPQLRKWNDSVTPTDLSGGQIGPRGFFEINNKLMRGFGRPESMEQVKSIVIYPDPAGDIGFIGVNSD
jgi:hypothetical protein